MRRRLLTLLLPALVGAAALVISAVLVSHESAIEQRALRSAFELGLRQTASRIEQRIASYELLLRGAQGLFHATGGRVTAADFATYVHAQLGGADATGMQGIGYVAADEGRAQLRFGAPPSATPQRLMGFDLLADPVRRAVLLQARDSGGVAVSRKLRLIQDGEGSSPSSFLMVLPVYTPGEAPADLAQRRQRHAGWVVAAFRMNDLMSSLYGEGMPGLALRIHDGVRLDAESLMYESAQAAAPAGTDAAPPRHEAHEYIGFAGHTWTLTVHTLPEFEALHAPGTPRIILGAGLVASLLLALLTYQLVSGRERAHAVAQAMTRELRESEQRYRSIVETADEGIWMLDVHGRTSFVNPKVLAMLGHVAPTPPGQAPEGAARRPHGAQPALLGQPLGRFLDEPGRVLVERFLARGADAAAEHHELRFRRADGADLWASLTMNAVVDASGRYAGTLAMITDISAAKQAEVRRQLLEAQLRESQKMEAVGTLAGGIAHDFNNIVAAILGNAALARETLPADAPAAAHLSQILQAGDHARSLVQQIVAFSRRQPLARVAQPLAPLVEAAASLLRATLPAGVELRTALSGQPVWAQVDANQLQQVLMNLGTNAWHALAGGAGRIELGLTCTLLDDDALQSIGGLQPGPHAHLWVADDGTGMDDATLARIFEPFFTTKPVGQGTGLGLAVVHGIVAAHQGAITVASRFGEGTRFDLYFPLAEAGPGTAAAPGFVDAATVRGRGERLLYVDDDAVMVMMVEALLERAGYRVRAFVDARAALDALRAEPEAFDLVITDYNMPELSGLDVVRALRFIRPALPVIISSGYLSEDIRAAAERAGVRHLLQKEYSTERLVPLVQQVLEEARA